MWCRRIELDGFLPMLHAVRNHVPTFAGRVIPGTRSDRPQLPDLAQRGTEMTEVFLGRFEPHMADRGFVACDRLTAADIIGFFAPRSTGTVGMAIEDRFPAVAGWFAACSNQPRSRRRVRFPGHLPAPVTSINY
ncbi:MAG: glutathione binding-like protein [Alphaproteobacteria bacterium]|nr:glutathione binding-like protein [Alphaproteobacteria bacterium]